LLIPAERLENDSAARFMQRDATKCNEMQHFRAFLDVAPFNRLTRRIRFLLTFLVERCTKMHQNAPLFRLFCPISDRLTGLGMLPRADAKAGG